jgi:hypothetical protein
MFNHISQKFILILSSHRFLYFPISLFLSRFHTDHLSIIDLSRWKMIQNIQNFGILRVASPMINHYFYAVDLTDSTVWVNNLSEPLSHSWFSKNVMNFQSRYEMVEVSGNICGRWKGLGLLISVESPEGTRDLVVLGVDIRMILKRVMKNSLYESVDWHQLVHETSSWRLLLTELWILAWRTRRLAELTLNPRKVSDFSTVLFFTVVCKWSQYLAVLNKHIATDSNQGLHWPVSAVRI